MSKLFPYCCSLQQILPKHLNVFFVCVFFFNPFRATSFHQNTSNLLVGGQIQWQGSLAQKERNYRKKKGK